MPFYLLNLPKSEFMTALSEVEHKVKALQLGAVDYITKPIQAEEVLARVNVQEVAASL